MASLNAALVNDGGARAAVAVEELGVARQRRDELADAQVRPQHRPSLHLKHLELRPGDDY